MELIKKVYISLLNRNGVLDKPIVKYSTDEANDLIKEYLSSPDPVMIGRFGAFELSLAFGIGTPFSLKNLSKLIRGEAPSIGLREKLCKSFCNNAGFFPNDRALFKRFAKLLLNDMKELDILGSWLPLEKQFQDELSTVHKIKRFDLEPFHHKSPWTKCLEGKKILVIHPYRDSIMMQYPKRKYLFPKRDILPEFNLDILKAVQSAGGTDSKFHTWFEALDFMKNEIDKRDFDIALIGCGAYGFHLAAHVKRIGRKSVHLGGVLQMCFGIIGRRWEHDERYSFVNEYWTRPLPTDYIDKALSIENGCYW